MELFKILGKIAVDNDEANKSIDDTAGKASNFGDKLKSGIGTVAKWGTAIVGGAAAAAGAMVKFAESSAETADNVDKMSQKIGVSREAYQELDFICSQSGMSVDSLQAGMKTLTGVIKTTADGTSKTATALEELGISATDSSGNLRNQEEVMWEALETLQGMEDQTKKAALASKLFGRSGTELMPLLNGASGSIEEMKQQAHDLGLVLSDELIDDGVNLSDSIDQTKRAFQSIITQLGGALMPIVTDVSEYIQQALPTIQGFISRLSPILTGIFEKIMPPLMSLCEALLPVVMDIIEQLVPVIGELLSQLLPIVTDVIMAILPLIQQLLPYIIQIVKALLPPLCEILNAFMPLLQPILGILGDLLGAILPPLTKVIEILAKAISYTLGAAFKAIKPLIESFRTYLGGIIKFISGVFSGDWSKAWEGIKQIFKGIWDGLITVVKAPLNAIIGMINKVFASIGSIKIPDWIPSIGGTTFSLPQIPKLAKGGVLEKGQVGFLEGDGAEAVVPLEQNTGWIKKVSQELNVNAVANDRLDRLEEAVFSILDCMSQYLPQMANMQLVTDTGALVGAIAPHMDKELGRRAARSGRGVNL